LIELDKKVFGKITTKEIIGADPPEIPDMKNIFEKELEILLAELESQPKENLENLLEQQKATENISTVDLALWRWPKIRFNNLTNIIKNMFKQLKKN
jgi:hypothetical protein